MYSNDYRVYTLLLVLHASFESAIPVQCNVILKSLTASSESKEVADAVKTHRKGNKAQLLVFANHLFPFLFHEIYYGQLFINRRTGI